MCEFWPSCEVCKCKASQRCAGCSLVYYCNKEHQIQHWKTHKKLCRPYKVEKSDTLGRYLVASRTIKSGEIILKEKPAVKGPAQNTGPVCMGCLENVNESNSIPCEFCGWPFCDIECQKTSKHKAECEFTVKYRGKVNVSNWVTPHPLFRLVTPLRVLLLENDSEKLNALESHCELRKNTRQWADDNIYVVQAMRRLFPNHPFKDDEILRACGILQVNGHEVPLSQPPHVAVYAGAGSLFEHSCVANCTKSFTDEKTSEITIWAARDIAPGEHLSICYTDSIWGTKDRQQDLLENKFFQCSCQRCMDPTELGSYTSALYCSNMKCGGYVLPTKSKTASEALTNGSTKLNENHNEDINDSVRQNGSTKSDDCIQNSKNAVIANAINWNSDWQCNNCRKSIPNSEVQKILEAVHEELLLLDRDNIDSCKSFLSRNASRLPISHYAMLGIEVALAHQLGSGGYDSIKHLTPEDLNFKIDLCEKLIEKLSTIALCEQRLLGLLRFELHSALAEKARRCENAERRHELLWRSLEAAELCTRSLAKEPSCLHEGLMASQAEKNAIDLRKMIC
ncbi:SET and MYND domain-containing protein DDB_G0277331-like [Ctenocephalides felis]|uniref:SET and MYND domain-containing protein DDB_G0277331-like n=1 Tax=Ctenocephalides felis TaxID=7515 RepID=UPI000E6E5B00|nr:SET and MYND domain-containing protein DDB_G0277331-like [Ctenocephalides felis]